MMQSPYNLTEEDQYLLRHVYCNTDLGRNYIALRDFIAQNGRYPSERGKNGRKLKPDDPERRLFIFIDFIKRNWPEPAGKQLMEKIPGWSWKLK